MKHWLVLESRKQYEAALKRIDTLMDEEKLWIQRSNAYL